FDVVHILGSAFAGIVPILNEEGGLYQYCLSPPARCQSSGLTDRPPAIEVSAGSPGSNPAPDKTWNKPALPGRRCGGGGLACRQEGHWIRSLMIEEIVQLAEDRFQ